VEFKAHGEMNKESPGPAIDGSRWLDSGALVDSQPTVFRFSGEGAEINMHMTKGTRPLTSGYCLHRSYNALARSAWNLFSANTLVRVCSRPLTMTLLVSEHCSWCPHMYR